MSTWAPSCTRSSCSRVASGASRTLRDAASPEASIAARIAFRRAGDSGWPSPISCLPQSGWVMSTVAITRLYRYWNAFLQMGFCPEKDGRLNAGLALLAASAGAGATVYEKVPTFEALKVKTNVPTLAAPKAAPFQAWEKGVPSVTYMSPLYCVGEVQLPTGITIQIGLKLPGDVASGERGS